MSIALSMAQLEGLLFAAANPNALIFAETNRVEDLQNRMVEIAEHLKTVQAKADGEKRSLSEEEIEAIENLTEEFDACEAEIERRNKIEAVSNKIAAPTGRKTDPDGSAPQNAQRAPRVPATPMTAGERDRWGWDGFGQFAAAVRHAANRGDQRVDPRLIANAPTSFGQEGVGADGGFAVPPEFRREIMVKVMGEASLISRTDQLTSSSNQITVPKDETTPWQTSGGVQAYWENEGAQLTQSKPSLEQATIRLNKLTSLVPVTEELLEDASALATYLRRKAPEKMNFRVNDAIINGTGAGQPLGILNAGALVTVDAESGQAADTINFNNIVNMWSRLYTGCRQNAVWLINQDIEPQLLGMSFPGTGTAVPVYLPPGGLSANPYGTLMGKPVIPTEACDTLGDVGDIILADLSTYMTATKTGGIRSDVSIHLWFDYDITAFRFIFRVAGQPWWSSAVSPKNGSATRSCFVTLAERS